MNANPAAALAVALNWGQMDDVHHKAWVIDQMVRHLTGSDYKRIIKDWCDDGDVLLPRDWDIGVAP